MCLVIVFSTMIMLNAGCQTRLINEGIGAVTGASPKVVSADTLGGLEKYNGLRVESVTMGQGVKGPASLAGIVQKEFTKAAEKKGLKSTGEPCLLVCCEIVHYESADMMDVAFGPFEEIVVRTQLKDAQTGQVLGMANLIGRAKTSAASGEEKLAEGAAKALRKWLRKGGLKQGREEDEK